MSGTATASTTMFGPEGFQMTACVKTAGVVIGVVGILSLLSKTTRKSPGYAPDYIKHIQRLVKQSMQFRESSAACSQPLVALQHSTLALAYARVAKSLSVKPGDVNKIGKVNVTQLIRILEDEQEARLKAVRHQCPALRKGSLGPTSAGRI
jgi:hypothetical protein